jgi:biopolymer transport protein TolR
MAEINVVPLVDVVLVLLIIFMVTAPLLYRESTSTCRDPPPTRYSRKRVVITVEKNQEIFIDKDRVTVDRVEPILETIKRRNPTVWLPEGRPGCPVRFGRQVMDAIKRVGIDKLGMVTEPATERGTLRKGRRKSMDP